MNFRYQFSSTDADWTSALIEWRILVLNIIKNAFTFYIERRTAGIRLKLQSFTVVAQIILIFCTSVLANSSSKLFPTKLFLISNTPYLKCFLVFILQINNLVPWNSVIISVVWKISLKNQSPASCPKKLKFVMSRECHVTPLSISRPCSWMTFQLAL